MQGIPPINLAAPSAVPLPSASPSPLVVGASSKAAPNVFEHLVEQTNQAQLNSDNAIQDFIAQKPGANVQQVVMSVARAEMSFQFFMEIRNKLIDSYNELMRMQF